VFHIRYFHLSRIFSYVLALKTGEIAKENKKNIKTKKNNILINKKTNQNVRRKLRACRRGSPKLLQGQG